MKRYLTLFFAVGMSIYGNAQSVNEYSLDLNNVDAIVNDGGVFFNDYSNSFHGYEVPNGSGLNAMYALGFWYGGVDVNGQLKLSAQKYEVLDDQFRGPLTILGQAEPPQSGTWTNAIFPITKSEIVAHQANYATPGYVVPPNILYWPAHGDVTLEQDYYLAPFVDTDGDGTYNPMAGDYPCIRGDNAAYVIMNDKGGLHGTGGEPIGIEMHYLFYEFDGIPEIENTTFVHLKMINRGTQTLNDFKVSTFLDGDIGYFGDDYIGSDSSRNLLFFYNGDNFDETAGGSIGYESAPPAIGLLSLANDFESMGIADAGTNAAQYWSNMNGRDMSDLAWAHPITMGPISYMFPSDPGDASQMNSEAALMNAPGDRRGLATINVGTLTPFSEHTFDYAVIYNRNLISNIDNASELKNVADIVQDFFDASFVNDCVSDTTLNLSELAETEFSIYPNPSTGEFTISFENNFSNAQVEILDISGRVVLDDFELEFKETKIELNQPSGVYLLHLIVDGQKTIKRIILE